MLPTSPDSWTERLVQTLHRYDEPLVRRVCERLFKPRNQWPTEELIERAAGTVANAAVIDRRLQGLEPAGRKLLAAIGHSRQPRWRLGGLMEVLSALERNADVRPVLELLESGLLFPDLSESKGRLRGFEPWLGTAAAPAVFAHPLVTERALGEDLGLPDFPIAPAPAGGVHEADGLEWPLRLAVAWQLVAAGPLRRTQQGDFFKRDLDRLRGDPVLNAAPADHLAEMPDAALLAVELAAALGLLREADGELTAAEAPAWDQGLAPLLETVWAALPQLDAWHAGSGWLGRQAAGNPYPSARLLAFLLLSRLPADAWADPDRVERWVLEHHPYWSASRNGAATQSRDGGAAGLETFLLGFAYQLGMLQAAKGSNGNWLVRLSALGRWLLGVGPQPATPPAYPQTLLVQPNLEIVAYRQGLTPGLIARLSQFAAWKNLGSACTLQLGPDTVYRALESGQTFDTIRQTLEQHGMRALPPAVVESLRTWANKRERLGVYPSATLFEFASADELNEALARGLPGTRLTDRLAVVADEGAVDFRHFRLIGTRDYGLPPEQCIAVGGDGVTLEVDVTRSDLMLETELRRFAESIDSASESRLLPVGGAAAGRRRYRLTPASLATVRDNGFHLQMLEEWFRQRTGQPLSPAARLLLTGARKPAPELRRQLVLHLPDEELADGLTQWPDSRGLIESRLGPTALAVAEENVEELRRRLAALGVNLQDLA